MPVYADPIVSLPALAATAPYLRVKDDGSGNVTPAGATDLDLGTTEGRALAAGDMVAVALRSIDEPVKMTAAGAFSKYALVYAAASGKIDDTATGYLVGIALEAAGASGDIVPVLRLDGRGFPGTQVANIAALGAASGTAATDIGTLYTKVNAILAALKTAAVMAAD